MLAKEKPILFEGVGFDFCTFSPTFLKILTLPPIPHYTLLILKTL